MRLQKYIAQCGVTSRRKAEQYILDGRITVNGKIVTILGTVVDPESDKVTCDGKKIIPEEKLYYFLLNKPKGYVTTLSDPQGRAVVTSLIKDCDARLFPVGRLDFDTEGALLLTNDGELAQKVQHPSFETRKTYEALVYGNPGKSKLDQLQKGIIIDGKITSPATLKPIKRGSKSALISITIHEGRKHQVKKMFQAIGHRVIALKRVSYGKLFIDKIPTGSYRQLDPSDLKKIFL